MENNLIPTPLPSPKPVTDLSPRVVQLARMLDRLPPGTYEISLSKQDLRAQDWNVEIVRTEKIVTVNLPRYNPE
jgi:hypothetical protein